MKGDFTRGHRPDQKRGEKYRRVLLQEGRLVLDSDIAASVDATDALIRDLASDVGCERGSPDLGYLVTPGPLFAIFETLDGVGLPAPGGGFKAFRDHGKKYQERFPSLYIGAPTAAGTVKIAGRRALATASYPKLRIWARVELGVTVQVTHGGASTSFLGADGTAFKPYDVTVPNPGSQYQDIAIGFAAPGTSSEVWIGLVEGLEQAGNGPRIWSTKGRYYLEGLAVEAAGDGVFPEASFPLAAGFDPPAALVGTTPVHLVAYLEGWERLVTRVEDPGILERALGGVIDTTVRSQAIGQVKVAFFAAGPDPVAKAGDVPAAFANVLPSAAKLVVTTSSSDPNPDPCAVPEAGGYTGADNRLYRFEVHTAGDLGTALLKWSRNNGSDMFAVTVPTLGTHLVLAPGAEVADGDLIELVDEADDLGDQDTALISLATPEVRPSKRRTGRLFYAQTTQTAGVIKLRKTNPTKDPTGVPSDFGKVHPKVRVWHGLLQTAPEKAGDPAVTAFDLGDGIHVELSGSDFRPGDYWHYEARKLQSNDNGPWKSSPHGPERLFAPLALLGFKATNQPLELLRWYDHQYSALCELDADDIAYDGDKVGTSADTVQEAIDELYLRSQGGCCDVVLEPKPSGDDSARIQDAVNALPRGGKLCFKRGVYRIGKTIQTIGKRIVLEGCPHATLVGDVPQGPVFVVRDNADLVLEDLLIFAKDATGPLVSLPPPQFGPQAEQLYPSRLTMRRTALVHAGEGAVLVRVGDMSPQVVDAKDPEPLADQLVQKVYMNAFVEGEDAILLGPWGIVADSLFDCTLQGCLVRFENGGLQAAMTASLRLERTALRAGLASWERDTLATSKPEDLDTTLTTILENQAGGSGGSDSVGITIAQLYGGVVEGCEVQADTGMFLGYAGDLTCRTSIFQGDGGPAVRLDEASGCRFEDNSLHAGRAAFQVPWGAQRLEILGSRVRFGDVGLLFGAHLDGGALPADASLYPYFHGIRVERNRLESCTVGIQIGPYGVKPDGGEPDPFFADLADVDISSNVIHVYETGILSSLMDPPDPEKDTVRRTRLRLQDNEIDAPLGMVLQGSRPEVRGNTVRAAFPLFEDRLPLGVSLQGARRIGLLAVDCDGLLVQENVIDLDLGKAVKEGGSVGIRLDERWSKGTRNALVIQGNVVTASQALVAQEGQHGGGTRDLLLSGNRFTSTEAIRVADLLRSALRSNSFFGPLRLAGGSNNVVAQNRFAPFSENAGALIIDDAAGSWQVSDNRASDRLLLQPVADPYVPQGDNYAAFLQYLAFWQDPAAGGGIVPAPYKKQIALVFSFFLKQLGVNVVLKEKPFHVQVDDNWADKDLVVGYPAETVTTSSGSYPPALPDMASTIQVVANRAGETLITNKYGLVVVANNFARAYSPPIGQVGPIGQPNFDAP